MKYYCRQIMAMAFVILFFNSSRTLAKEGWSVNLGYHNPPGATIGVNFLRFWTNLAFELGVGWLDLSSSTRTNNSGNGSTGSSSFGIAGDANLKYLFGSGGLRPYIQGGLSVGSVTSVGDNTGVAAGTGGGFFGGGLFLIGQKIYGYGSINSAGGLNTFVQGGLGFYF